LEVGLDHEVYREHAGEIKELLAILRADVDAVAAPVVFLAEGADELALRVEDDDRVLGLFGRLGDLVARPMLDVDKARPVDRHPVGRAPADRAGRLAPVVETLVAMLPLADNWVGTPGLVAAVHERSGCGSRRSRGQGRRAGLLQEVASTHGEGPFM